MLKVQIKRDNLDVCLTSNAKKELPREKLEKFLSATVDLLYEEGSSEKTLETVNPQNQAPTKIKAPETSDNTFVRGKDRLPNPVSVNGVLVDPSNTKVIHPEKRQYRCPNCGQSNHFLIYTGSDTDHLTFVKRNNPSEDYDVVASWTKEEEKKMSKKEKDKMIYNNSESIQSFIESIKSLPVMKDATLVINEDESNGKCVICGKTESMVKWNEAYVTPEDFFEVLPRCDDCGGEIEVVNKKVAKGSNSVAIRHCVKCKKEFK